MSAARHEIDVTDLVHTAHEEIAGGAPEARLTQAARAALRRYGGDCYLYGMLASGHCDLVVEVQLKPHDFMAVVPVVQGAGGRISDWQGSPLTFASDGRVLAAGTEALWQQALEELRRA